MRMLFVIITGVSLLFIITVGWYIGMAVGVSLIAVIFPVVEAEGQSVATLINYALILWGPFFDILVVLWMIASAQANDVESSIYG